MPISTANPLHDPDVSQAGRASRPDDCGGDMPAKVLFTSPVIKPYSSAKTLGPVKEGLLYEAGAQPEDVSGKSPTAAL